MPVVKFPSRRQELESFLQELSDTEYQRKAWGAYDSQRGFVYDGCFGDLVHFLFDDTPLAEDPYGHIGYALISSEEAERVRLITSIITDRIRKRYGRDADATELLDTEEWKELTEASRELHELMILNDSKILKGR